MRYILAFLMCFSGLLMAFYVAQDITIRMDKPPVLQPIHCVNTALCGFRDIRESI